jgi:hypothetical protein
MKPSSAAATSVRRDLLRDEGGTDIRGGEIMSAVKFFGFAALRAAAVFIITAMFTTAALGDEVVIARADHFSSTDDSEFLSVEAKSSDDDGVTLTVELDAGPGTAIGDGGSVEAPGASDPLSRRVRAASPDRARVVPGIRGAAANEADERGVASATGRRRALTWAQRLKREQ